MSLGAITPGTLSGDLFAYRLRLRRPLETGGGAITARSGVLLRLRSADNGPIGWGDAAPLPGREGPGLAQTAAALERWLADGDAFEGDLRRVLNNARERLKATPCAWAAAGAALADLAARLRRIPLCEFLIEALGLQPNAPQPAGPHPAAPQPAGPHPAAPHPAGDPRAVPTAALVEGKNADEVAAGTAQAAAAGHKTLKLKLGFRPISEDLKRVAALRRAAGQGVSVRLDANGAWTPSQAEANLRALAEFEPEFVEEPTSGLDELRGLQLASPVPLAVDESLPGICDIPSDGLGMDYAVLKPTLLGAPTDVASTAAALRRSNTKTVISSALESAVGLTTALHLSAALGGEPAGLGTSGLFEFDLCEPPRLSGGALEVPPGAGLGAAPNMQLLRPARFSDNPQPQREGGPGVC